MHINHPSYTPKSVSTLRYALMISFFVLLLVVSISAFADDPWCNSKGHEGPFLFQWTPKDKGEDQEGTLEIKDSASNQAAQLITGRSSRYEKFVPEFTDYNFDGCPDLSWEESGSSHNPTKAVFLYDRSRKLFINSAQLSDLANLGIHDKRKRCLYSSSHGGFWVGTEETYCWNANKLILTERVKFQLNEDKGCVDWTNYRLFNSKLKKISHSCKSPAE